MTLQYVQVKVPRSAHDCNAEAPARVERMLESSSSAHDGHECSVSFFRAAQFKPSFIKCATLGGHVSDRLAKRPSPDCGTAKHEESPLFAKVTYLTVVLQGHT